MQRWQELVGMTIVIRQQWRHSDVCKSCAVNPHQRSQDFCVLCCSLQEKLRRGRLHIRSLNDSLLNFSHEWKFCPMFSLRRLTKHYQQKAVVESSQVKLEAELVMMRQIFWLGLVYWLLRYECSLNCYLGNRKWSWPSWVLASKHYSIFTYRLQRNSTTMKSPKKAWQRRVVYSESDRMSHHCVPSLPWCRVRCICRPIYLLWLHCS